MSYQDTLKAEVATWLIEDQEARREKFRRERIRHYRLIRDLLLDKLDCHNMDVIEVGGGPMPISDLLRFRSRRVIDPLSDEYRTVIPCPDHVTMRAEDMVEEERADLVISTNSLDHVENPDLVLMKMVKALRPGGFMAVQCAENNAIVHPHPAHQHNISADWLHRRLDEDFETVSEWNWRDHGYRYGWVAYEGARGQPAFACLFRKCVGYE
jgi:SAM-dependent methyltransferase